VLFAHFINVNKANTTRNLFYLFDSHKRDSNGFHSENGASVLLQFDSLDEVLLFLFNHYTGYSYELTPVLFPTRFTSNSPHSNERKRKSETVNPIIIYRRALSVIMVMVVIINFHLTISSIFPIHAFFSL
jgi:hypothetical protein